MYNEKQKSEFISSHTSSDKTSSLISMIFNWFEPYEKDWGMDLSLQSAEILQPVVVELTGVRVKSAELILIILTEYVKWSGKNGYEVSNGIFDVKINTIYKIQEQMVASPLHLKSRLDYFFGEAKNDSINIIFRVFLWMAFFGMQDKDAVRVSVENVDLLNSRINFEGHSYEIYKESREDFEKACYLKEFNYEHNNPYYVYCKDRASGDLIMRGISSSKVDLMTIRPALNRKLLKVIEADTNEKKDVKRNKSKISYKRIYLSGVFYREYERERAGFPVNFSTFVAMEMERREKEKNRVYTTNKSRTRATIANKIECEYLEDYEKWKCAFAT